MSEDASYSWSIEDNASLDDFLVVWDGLEEYGRTFVDDDSKALNILLRDADGKVAGGLLGETKWAGFLLRRFGWTRARAEEALAQDSWPLPNKKPEIEVAQRRS